jgi:hypothetical protein
MYASYIEMQLKPGKMTEAMVCFEKVQEDQNLCIL